MIDMMDNETILEKFPVIAYIQEKRESKTEEEKKAGMEMLKRILKQCNYNSYVSLLELAESGGGGGGGFAFTVDDNSDNTSISYVDPDALGGFYDDEYYDSYDYEENEATNSLDLNSTPATIAKRQADDMKVFIWGLHWLIGALMRFSII